MTDIDATNEAFIFTDLKKFLCRDELDVIHVAPSQLSHVTENDELLSGLLAKPVISFSVRLKE